VLHTEYDSSLDIEHTGYEQSVLRHKRVFHNLKWTFNDWLHVGNLAWNEYPGLSL